MLTERQFTLSEVIIKTSNRLRAIANRFVFRGSGITGSQFCILRLLSKKNQNATEILKLIGGTKSNLSQRIKSLAKTGLVARVLSKKGSDHRNIYLKITPKGSRLVTNLMQRFQKAARKLEKQFSEKELESQFKFLKKMNVIISTNEEKLPQIFQI